MSTAVCPTQATKKPGKNRTGSRTPPRPLLSDQDWACVERFFADPPRSRKGGRPRVAPRPCLEGILWILQTGSRWQDLPERYPSPSTCWRRLQEWTESGVFQGAWRHLLRRLDGLKSLQWEQSLADGTFSPAKKGGLPSA
jgi:transposase